jgi:hypothetical protein
MRFARLFIAALLLAAGLTAHAQDNPRVRVDTNLGKFVIELDRGRAPLTVANFLEYVKAGHYNGTIFHRVIANFVAQGGGYDEKSVRALPTSRATACRTRAAQSALRARAILTAAPRSSISIWRTTRCSIRSRAAGATRYSAASWKG